MGAVKQVTGCERLDMCRMWAKGASLVEVMEASGRSRKTVWSVVEAGGGLRPRRRGRAAVALSASEREEISRGLGAGLTFRELARALDRAPSTISREVGRNGGRDRYRAVAAEQRAFSQAARPKVAKLADVGHARLREVVEDGLGQRWSPQQIALRLTMDYPDDPQMRVSPETIYQSIYVQGRGALRKELAASLRSGRARRRPQSQNKRFVARGQIADMVNISERPASVQDRAVPGHWEGDLIIGKDNKSAIGTLVERSTRYVMLLALPDGHSAEAVLAALTRQAHTLPAQLWRTLTWDQGKEMAHHVRFSVATGIDVYFCDPHSPWQRGTNENTNGLLRQYFPKGTDLSPYTQLALDAVAQQLNGRPRQTLGGMKPSEKFAELVATAA